MSVSQSGSMQCPTEGVRYRSNFTPKKVVYAIALKSGEPVRPKTLFTFAQVAMYRAVRQLRAANIEVEIVTISR